MPILRHAKKKLRQDKKRTARNRGMKENFRDVVKKANEEKTPKAISAAFSAIDKAVKNHFIHKNKAGHMKSSLSKILAGKAPATVATKPASKAKTSKAKKAVAAKKTPKKA